MLIDLINLGQAQIVVIEEMLVAMIFQFPTVFRSHIFSWSAKHGMN